MSYTKPDTGDMVQDEIITLIDFTMLAQNLIKAQDQRAFLIWFDKLNAINRRALRRYLRNHKNEIPSAHFKIAKSRFAGRL